MILPLLCALIDAAVALMVLLGQQGRLVGGRLRPPVTIRRVPLAVTAAGAAFAVKLPLLHWLGVNVFGFIHVVYLELVVALPLVGAVLLASSVSRRVGRLSAPSFLLAVACCVPAPAGVYASFVEPFRLRLESVDVNVPARREGDDPVRVGVLADIQTAHVTDYEREAVRRLMALKPDVILIPGDLFQGGAEAFEREEKALRGLLSELAARGGVYFVLGNVDSRPRIERLIEGTEVRLLVNQVVDARVGDRRLSIGGVQLQSDSVPARHAIDRLESALGEDDIRILVAHYPDAVTLLSSPSRVDLLVAGHTHGGQVQLPFFGPPITLSRVPRHIAAGGLHRMGGRRIYVSRGVGCERGQAPRIRFLAPPEISLLVMTD